MAYQDEKVEEKEIILESISKIMSSIDEDEPYTAINQTDLLLKFLSSEFKKKHDLEKLESKLKVFLLNVKNNRLLRLNQRIKVENENAIEYYAEDIGTDERLIYLEELEKTLLNLQDEIRTTLAKIIRYKLNEDNIDELMK